MSVVVRLATKPNVEAAWQHYIDLLHQVQIDPALQDDLQHVAAVAEAESEWRQLFMSWSKTDPSPRKIAQ